MLEFGHLSVLNTFSLFFLNLHLRTCLLILERGKERKRRRETNLNVREKNRLAASCMHPDQGLNPQPGHKPHWELNLQLFVLWDDAPAN